MPETEGYRSVVDDLSAIREDVAYIKAKIEVLPDLEERTRKLEKRVWGIPGSLIVAIGAALGIHLT